MGDVDRQGSLTHDPDERDEDSRGTWQGQFESALTLIGYSVGLGNIWRFPYLCYKNGGGAFIIPFLLFMTICGLPLFYLELCIGQFSGKSPLHVWAISPLFKGLGVVMLTISVLYCWYYGMIIGWVYYYLIQSFYPTLGWSTCDNSWNTPNCIEIFRQGSKKGRGFTDFNDTSSNSLIYNITGANLFVANNVTGGANFSETNANVKVTNTAASEFWENNVLGLSSGIDELGSIQWHLFGSLALGWVIVFFCLVKGVKSVGKVVYVTVIAPYVLLTVLLVRGITLDGSWDGLKLYLNPDFTKLGDPRIWQDAAVQVFYSLGPAWGGVITMASFNKFHHKAFRDAVIVCIADAFTAIFAGLPVFAVLGYLAKETGKSIDSFKASGPGLVFIAYPEALSRLPWPQFWSVLFFVTLVFVGIDSMFTTFKTVSATVVDMYFKQLNKRKTMVVGVLIGIILLTSLPLTMSGGYYILLLMDWYIGTFNVVITALLETIVVAWIYGADRLSDDIEMMFGRRPPLLLRIVWVICVPLFVVSINIMTFVSFSAPYYGKDGYVFPDFAVVIGVMIAFLPLCSIPAMAIAQIYSRSGPISSRIKALIQTADNWEPNDRKMRELYSLKPYIYEKNLCSRIKNNVLGLHASRKSPVYEESTSMTSA